MIKKLALLFCIALSLPLLVSAAGNGSIHLNTNVWTPRILQGPLVVCTGSFSAPNNGGLPQCSNFCDIIAEVIEILYFMMGVAIWIILPIYFAFGGVMFIISRGNEHMVSAARSRITEAFWGLCIMLCAWLIVSTVVNFFPGFSSYVAGFGANSSCVVTPGGGACGGFVNGYCPNGQTCQQKNGTSTYSCQ